MNDLRIKAREAKAAQLALVGAYRALATVRVNPLAWLALVHRQFHPGSDASRTAALLAAMNPRYSAVHLRSLAAPLILSEANTRAVLVALQRAGFLTINPTMRTAALELTLRTPACAGDPEIRAAGGQLALPEGRTAGKCRSGA